jgi:hypothetical protein
MTMDTPANRTPIRAALTLTVVACATVLGLSACSGTEESEPAAVEGQSTVSAPAGVKNQAARRFVDAVNAGDTDQVLATLTDDAVVIDSGRRFADRTAIRNWIDTRSPASTAGSRSTASRPPPTASSWSSTSDRPGSMAPACATASSPEATASPT